jgi:hypothetical protein
MATHWSDERVMGMTETQIALWVHAFWVNGERQANRREAEITCQFCFETQVRDGVCSACKRRQMQGPDTLNVRVAAAVSEKADTLQWPPGVGEVYKGDEYESAARKFQRACMERGDLRPYMDYCNQINRDDSIQEFLNG